MSHPGGLGAEAPAGVPIAVGPAAADRLHSSVPAGGRLIEPSGKACLSARYQPNFGGRFSRKAAMPSWASGVVAAAAMACVVYS